MLSSTFKRNINISFQLYVPLVNIVCNHIKLNISNMCSQSSTDKNTKIAKLNAVIGIQTPTDSFMCVSF